MDPTGPRDHAHPPTRPPAAWRTWVLATVAGAWLGFLLRAPSGIPVLWAFDGFRSIDLRVRMALLAAVVAVAVLAWTRPSVRLWTAAGLAAAALVAFPLRERIHWLSDTALRLNAWHEGVSGGGIADWQRVLHAAPLDQLLGFRLPVALHRLGMSEVSVASLLSVVWLLVYALACVRIARRFAVEPRDRPLLAAFVLLAGALQAFAGYAESAGLLLAAFAWWLAFALEPLPSRAAAVRLVALWLGVGLCHRLALLVWPVLLVRALWPAYPEDQRGARRTLLIAALVALAALAGLQGAGGGGQLGVDARDALRAWGALLHAGTKTRIDLASALLLLAPAAVTGVVLATRTAWRTSRPELGVLALAAVPLLAVLPALPLGANGLGIERDWDLLALPALLLGVAGVALIARAAAPVRVAAVLMLPVVALQTGAWLAVNADALASVDRAIALASDPNHLAAPQRSHLLMLLGDRASSAEDPLLAADLYERSFRLSGNPRRALYAASAWLAAGDTDSAAVWVSVARRLPLVSPGVSLGAAWIDSAVRVHRSRPPQTAAIPPPKH